MLKSLFNVASIGKIYYNSWTKVGPVGVIIIIAKDKYSAIYEKWSLLLKIHGKWGFWQRVLLVITSLLSRKCALGLVWVQLFWFLVPKEGEIFCHFKDNNGWIFVWRIYTRSATQIIFMVQG